MAAIGNALAGDVLRDAFATKAVRKVLQPIIGMETFNAGPRAAADRPPLRDVRAPRRPGSPGSRRPGPRQNVTGPAPAVDATGARRRRGEVRPRTGDRRLAARSTGAAGYLVHRAAERGWAVARDRSPGRGSACRPSSARTSTRPATPGTVAWYAVAGPAIDRRAGRAVVGAGRGLAATAGGRCRGERRRSMPAADGGPVERPWRPIIGSEHLALLLRGEGPGGHHVGDELTEAFRIVRARARGRRWSAPTRSSTTVLGVYRERDGQPIHDFERVDAVLDRLLATGLRPVIELSFMPRDLAVGPGRSPSSTTSGSSRRRATWGAGRTLVAGSSAHLIDRFGQDEVRSWAFEVWNEPNLRVFWSADEAAYFDLYDAIGPGGQVGRSDVAGRRSGDRGRRLGRRPPGLTSRRPTCRSTSSRPTRTASHRSTSARSPLAFRTSRTSRCGGPSGASRRPTARRSTTASGPRRSLPAACARPPVASSRLPTGSPRTTSSSSA